MIAQDFDPGYEVKMRSLAKSYMDSKIKCQEISVIRWLMGRLDVAEDRVLDLEAACELSQARLHSKKRDHDHLTEMHAIAIVALSDQLLKTEAYKKCMNLYKNASVAWCASVDDPVFLAKRPPPGAASRSHQRVLR